MWFSNAMNLLSGCTVKSATLTLHRKTGSGSSAAKSVYLCAITNSSAMLENAAHLGLPIPEKLKGILAQLHNRDEKTETTESDGN